MRTYLTIAFNFIHFRVFGLRVDNKERFIAVIVVTIDSEDFSVREEPCSSLQILLIYRYVRDFLPRLKLIVDEAHEIEAAARRNNDEIVLDANFVAYYDR